MADPAFPNLPNATAFPGIDNVNVYRYENTFDYSRWGADTVFKCLNVPWCSDYENVVDFGSETARDTWFDSQSGDVFSMNTMFHAKPTLSIKLPIPVGVLTRYNYLMVRLPTPTSDASPIAYERTTNRTGRFFFFIMDAVQVAPSTTLAELQLDVWTTYRYGMEFKWCMLERGHAPVAAISVGQYLVDPKNNCSLLTAPDVNFGRDPSIVKSTEPTLINDPQAGDGHSYAVFLSNNGIGTGGWGGADYPTFPAASSTMAQGVLSPTAYALELGDLEGFLAAIDTDDPQFKASVIGVLFVDDGVVTFRQGSVSIAGYSLRFVDAAQVRVQAMGAIKQSDFGYPEEYAGFAKLYTWPYACIELNNGQGRTDIVRIEDTPGQLVLYATLSMIAGAVRIDGRVVNVGGPTATLNWHQYNLTRQFTYGGRWLEHLLSWDVPVMSVTLAGAIDAQWRSAYIRRHQQLAATNAQANAIGSANTNQSNANDTALTTHTNANNSAANVTANNTATVARNTSVANTQNSNADATLLINNQYVLNNSYEDMNNCTAGYQAELAGLAVAASNNTLQAASSAVSSIVGVGLSAATGDIGGVIGSATGIVNTMVDYATTNASNTISQSNAQTIYNRAIQGIENKRNYTRDSQSTLNGYNTQTRSSIVALDNTCANTIAANNAGLINRNADNAYDLSNRVAGRTHGNAMAIADRDYATAVDAIAAQLNQDSARPAAVYGNESNLEYAGIRPQALFASILTQDKGAIAGAASQFARWGYQLNQRWNMNNDLQVMDHFTYWKCSDLWVVGTAGVIEGAQQRIKDIMMQGVTVWGSPEDIGNIDPFDNM